MLSKLSVLLPFLAECFDHLFELVTPAARGVLRDDRLLRSLGLEILVVLYLRFFDQDLGESKQVVCG